MNFLEKVEPYITSDDSALREFALRSIHEGFLGTEQTFLLALQAMDKLLPNKITNPIFPYTTEMPVTEKVLKEIIARLEKRDGNFRFYLEMLEQCDFELLAEFEKELEPFVNKVALKEYINLHSLDDKELRHTAEKLTCQVATAEEFDIGLFHNGRRLFRELIKRGAITVEDIEKEIKKNLDKDYFSLKGIYYIYLAGELKVTTVIPILAELLVRDEEEILVETVTEALIKMGNEEVVNGIEKYIETEYASILAIHVLRNVKLPISEEILHKYFDKVDVNTKISIAEALNFQLSTQVILETAELHETIEDDQVKLELTESLYGNCIINGIEHPKLQEWKAALEKQEAYWEEKRKERNRKKADEQGIGRNDPCVCGSGRKFKKCCGK